MKQRAPRRRARRGNGPDDVRNITGGSGDVNPQFLSFSAAQSGSDATTSTQQTLPIEKYGNNGQNRARVVEILKVFLLFSIPAETDALVSFYLSTNSNGTTIPSALLADSRVFAASTRRTLLTTSGLINVVEPTMLDLTDGAGHGLLIATDNIFAQVSSTGTSLTNTVYIKILYRFKEVGLTEYIGIVQSQQ
jgi:hypothetical protein